MTKSGYGTIDNPISLADAVSGINGRILPGHTIYLRGGVYTGTFACTLVGTAELPINIVPVPGETPILDGRVIAGGQYVTWKDIEFRYSGWVGRDTIPNETMPTQGVDLSGIGIKMIGCVFHDTAGNGSWQTNVGGGFYECLIYNCGYLSPNRPHGHAIYTQNETATQEHHNNILWGQYGYGMHAYTESGLLNNFVLQNNICFRNGGRQFAVGGLGGQRARTSTLDGNVMLEGDGWLKGSDIILSNNYSPNGFTIDALSTNITESGNTFTAPDSGVNIFVFPRANKAGWAHVAIYNWDEADSVDVDLTSDTGLEVGDTYKLHNAQDYFVDIVTGTLPANKTIAVDMRAASHTVAARIGSTSTVATTFPAFGAFVVKKV